MTTSGLELINVSKSFGDNRVILDLTYSFQPGITLITGSNGCGKSTLFQLIGGYLKPEQGTILLNQQKISGLPPFETARMGLGFLFQDIRVFRRMSVLDNLLSAFPKQTGETLNSLFNVRAIKRAQQQNVQTALKLAKELGLAERITDLAETLSYGNKKRLAFGRLMAANASVYLLDELSAGVDPHMRQHLRTLLIDIKKQGKTCLMIEHDLEFSADLADRVLCLEQGCLKELKQAGQYQPLLVKPSSVQALQRAPQALRNVVLEIKDVSVAYGQRIVLEQVNLQVKAGDVTGIFGSNGSGKSSLLRAIAGHLKVGGSIQVQNKLLNNKSVYERQNEGVGYLMQGGLVFSTMTVEANLRLNQYQLNKDVLAESLQFFPILQPLLLKRAGLLSGGERQQLALAMILQKKPRLLLLDEPSAGIEPSQRKQFFTQLKNMAKQGIAVLMVEQRLQEPLEIIDQAYFVNHGKLQKVALGSLADFFMGTTGGVQI